MREMIREYDVKLACTLHSAPLGSFADEAVIGGHYRGYRCHHFQVYFVLHLGTELIGEGASSQTMSPPQRVTRIVDYEVCERFRRNSCLFGQMVLRLVYHHNKRLRF